MNSIFNYHNSQSYLQDLWSLLKSKNNKFSFRSFATYLELDNHAPLHQMLLGKRKIAKNVISKIATKFSLSKLEYEYLTLLAERDYCKSSLEQMMLNEKIADCIVRHSKQQPEILHDPKIQGDPIHFSIMEMAWAKPFPNDPEWVKSKLLKDYKIEEIELAIHRLLIAGLIAPNKSGLLYRTKVNFLFSVQDKVDLSVRNNARKLCDMAKDAMENQPLEKRECNFLLFNIDPQNLPEIKEEIRTFMKDLLCKYETNQNVGGQVYNLNTHFFPITEEL